mmetsp:Transcript_18055/g.45140  ORF Transcript_18055/g.45140 Transcript_18055/m.45140 type:complete len:144 (-) Transcript_18055:91-522(-)
MKLATLDARLVLRPRTVELRSAGLRVGGVFTLSPRSFLPQAHLPQVKALWLLPLSSSSLTVSHRLLTSRTQTRQELPPGAVLFLGPRCRAEWALAIPPLRDSVEHSHAAPTRYLMVFVDRADASGSTVEGLDFHVHHVGSVGA